MDLRNSHDEKLNSQQKLSRANFLVPTNNSITIARSIYMQYQPVVNHTFFQLTSHQSQQSYKNAMSHYRDPPSYNLSDIYNPKEELEESII